MRLQRKEFWRTRTLCVTTALCVAMVSAASGYDYSDIGDTMEFIEVGNTNNAADTRTGDLYGAVDYVFEIGKTHVNVWEWYEANELGAGLTRGGGIFTQSASNRPVNRVDGYWLGAAAYANFLTTGNTSNGVYTFYYNDSGTRTHSFYSPINTRS